MVTTGHLSNLNFSVYVYVCGGGGDDDDEIYYHFQIDKVYFVISLHSRKSFVKFRRLCSPSLLPPIQGNFFIFGVRAFANLI